MAPECIVIGLTGGIGSGKSTVAGMLVQLGAIQIDTDLIAHALTASGGAAIEPIRNAFGADVISADGALDRAAMRERVFGAPTEKTRLEGILHPLIRATAQGAMDVGAKAHPPYILLTVPLLFESSGFRHDIHRTLTVDCPTRLQVERVRDRSGLNEATIAQIMAAQLPRAIRLQLADDVVINAGGRPALDAQVATVHQRYLELARARPRIPAAPEGFVNPPPIRHNSASPGPRP